MYAISETGGKEYRVKEGDVLKVEKLPFDIDSTFSIDRVLAISDDNGWISHRPIRRVLLVMNFFLLIACEPDKWCF